MRLHDSVPQHLAAVLVLLSTTDSTPHGVSDLVATPTVVNTDTAVKIWCPNQESNSAQLLTKQLHHHNASRAGTRGHRSVRTLYSFLSQRVATKTQSSINHLSNIWHQSPTFRGEWRFPPPDLHYFTDPRGEVKKNESMFTNQSGDANLPASEATDPTMNMTPWMKIANPHFVSIAQPSQASKITRNAHTMADTSKISTSRLPIFTIFFMM